MITQSKARRILFLSFSLACFVAAGICVICDVATDGGLSWAAYPLAGILLAWLVASPLFLAARNRLFWALIVLTAAILPFLYIIQLLAPVTGWFAPLALPVAVTAAASLWAAFFLAKLLKHRICYLLALLTLLFGVGTQLLIRLIVSNYAGRSLIGLDMAITTLACLTTAAVLAIIGYGVNRRGRN